MHIGYVKNELTKRKRRSLFVIFGIALSISVFVAVNSLSDAFMAAAQKPLQELGSDIIIQRSGDTPEFFEGATIPCAQVIITADELAAVQEIEGITQMSTALLMWVFEGEDYSDSSTFKIVTGIETSSRLGPGKANDWLIDGKELTEDTSGAVLVDSVYANQNGIKTGDSLLIAGQPFEVYGIVQTPTNSLISASNVFVSLKDAQSIASQSKSIPDYKNGDINEIFLQIDPSKQEQVTSKLTAALPGATITSSESFVEAIGGIAAQSRTLAVLASIIVLLLSMVIVAKTISGNIMERRNEIGIMKTVGWTSADISKQILMETLVQSIAGGVIGVGIGLIAALLLGNMRISIPVSWDIDPFPHFMMTNTSQKMLDVGLPFVVSSTLIIIAFGIALAVGLLSAFLTLKNISKIKPSEVLRYE